MQWMITSLLAAAFNEVESVLLPSTRRSPTLDDAVVSTHILLTNKNEIFDLGIICRVG